MQRSLKNRDRLTDDELAFVHERLKTGQPACPDCSEGILLEGPSGGLSVNVYCGNPKCGSKFNDMGPFGWERISDVSPQKPREMVKTGPFR